MKDGYVQKPHNGKVRRWVQTMELRDNPALIAEYRKRHSQGQIWPEILQGIRDCGLYDMEIYILGTRLVMICDGPEDLNWDEAMQKMAQGPRQAEWEAFMSTFQQCGKDERSDEKWHMMERMFHVYEEGEEQKLHTRSGFRYTTREEYRSTPAPKAIRHSLMGIWGQDGLPSSEDIRMTTRKSHD